MEGWLRVETIHKINQGALTTLKIDVITQLTSGVETACLIKLIYKLLVWKCLGSVPK